MQTPVPDNEAKRLEIIRSVSRLGPGREPWADDIAALAAGASGLPLGFVSVIGEDEQIFKGAVGMDAERGDRGVAFCSHTILGFEPMHVPDALLDDRFKQNPLVVNDPRIRAYAGVPIVVEGCAIGTVGVAGTEPVELSGAVLEALSGLARLAKREVMTARVRQAEIDSSLDAIITISTDSEVLEYNRAAAELFGYSMHEAIGRSMPELIVPPSLREAHKQGMERYLKTGEGPVLGQRIEITAMRRGGEEFPIELAISPVKDDDGLRFTAFLRDLTEIREQNKNLRLARFTLDRVGDPVFWVDRHARFVACNDAACKNLGYTREQILEMTVFDVDSMLPERAWPGHWDELTHEGTLVLESRHRRSDGSEFPVEVSCNLIAHEDLELNCVVARDVTERAEAESALRESEQRFRDIVSAAGEFVWELDAERRVRFVTGPAEDVFGRPVDALLGLSLEQLLGERGALVVSSVLDEAQQGREAFRDVRFRFEASDGGTRWLRWSGTPVWDGEEQLRGFRGAGLDITASVTQGERAMLRTNVQMVARAGAARLLDESGFDRAAQVVVERLAELLEAEAGFFLEIDPESMQGRVAGALGVDGFEGLEGRSFLASGGVWQRAGQDIVLSVREAPGFIAELGWEHHLGIPIVNNGTAVAYIGFGTAAAAEWPAEVHSVLRDIGVAFGHAIERRTAQAKLAHSTKMLEAALVDANAASEAKTGFLAHISHELRTPLTAVLGFTQILKEGQLASDDREDLLQKIDRSGRALLQLIDDTLDLSRLEARSLRIRNQPVNVPRVISAVVDSVSGMAREKDLPIRVEIADGFPAAVVSDELRLSQVVTNLLTNAVKYTQAGGIGVRLGTESIGTAGRMCIEVEDTGDGIPEYLLDKIFDSFERGAAQGDGRGSGLGLAICGGLVNLLGGEIEVKSTLGKGSTFRVVLPMLAAGDAAGQDKPQGDSGTASRSVATDGKSADAVDLAGFRVLVVEDNELVREIASRLLESLGAEVEHVTDGQQAVERLKADDARYSVVLMDMQMPVMDGYTATMTLRQAGYSRPIVALTAHGMAHDRERCLSVGCDEYLSKPIDKDAMAEVCYRLGKRYAEQAAPQKRKKSPSRMDDLLARYTEHLKLELAYLDGVKIDGDLSELRRRVHKLAGSAGNFGYEGVTEFARSCENAIRTEADGGQLRMWIDELRAELRKVLS